MALASSDVETKKGEETEAPVQELTSENDLYFDVLNYKNEDSYNISTVKYGDIIKQESTAAVLYYPISENITIPVEFGTVDFVEMLVKTGDKVKKGDPVIKIKTSIDEVTLEEQTLELKRLQEAYNRYVSNQPRLLKEQKKALENITDKQDKKIAILENDKANLFYEINKKNQESTIYNLKEKIKESTTIKNTKELLAPVDGFVSYASNPMPREKLDYRKMLVTIIDPSTVYFKASDSTNSFHYNMNVKIEVNPTEDSAEKIIQGKVIYSVPSRSDDGRVQSTCFIKPDEKISIDEVYNKNLKATVDVCMMKNVLVVPKDMLEENADDINNNYLATVYELQDDNLIERKFVRGMWNSEYCQVLVGLDEGIKIVKKQ